jgi:hypothetical protein
MRKLLVQKVMGPKRTVMQCSIVVFAVSLLSIFSLG